MKTLLKTTTIATMVALGCLSLPGCGPNGIRNPIKTQPRVVLAPLPSIEPSFEADKVWAQRTTRGSKYFTKIRAQVDAHTIFQADFEGKIVAIAKSNGRKIWKVDTHAPIASGPTLLQGQLYVGTRDGRLMAFHPLDGKKLWEALVPSEVLSAPQSNGDVVLVNSIDGSLTAVSAIDGSKVWDYNRSIPSLILRGGSAPLIYNNQALAGFSSGKFAALDLKNGNLLWEQTITQPRGRSELHRMVDIQANPVIIGDDVIIASYQGNLASVNIKTGNLNWDKKISVYKDLAFDGDTLYLTDDSDQIIALNTNDGTTRWKQDGLGKRLITGPTLTDKHVVVGDYGGYVHWLDKTTGQFQARYRLRHKIKQKPVSDGKLVYVTGENGEMIALTAVSRGDV